MRKSIIGTIAREVKIDMDSQKALQQRPGFATNQVIGNITTWTGGDSGNGYCLALELGRFQC